MIRFSKYIWLYFLISSLVLVPGIVSLVRWGLRPSVDFTGGTLLELQLPASVSDAALSEAAAKQNLRLAGVQRAEGGTAYLRIPPGDNAAIAAYERTLTATASGLSATIVREETVGPTLGRELLTKAMIAAAVAIISILGYVAYAFKSLKYGVCAILALLHDLLVVIGSFSLLGKFLGVEVDTLFVTAFLTTMSFSVHDTIVVFDRIREFSRRGDRADFSELADTALTETMTRSLTNSFTIVFMLVALILLGGETVRWFIVALLIGTVSGTYSSPFVATPLLILWDRREKRKK